MKTGQKSELIAEEIKGMTSEEIMELNNLLCEDLNNMDDLIYYNDEEFFEIYFTKALDAVQAVHFGNYNYSDDFVKFNGYGNLDSFSFLDENNLPDLLPNMIECILENPQNYEHLFSTELN